MDIKKHTIPLLVFLAVVTSASAVYFYQRAAALKANPDLAAQKEAADVVSRLGKLILLPAGEIPTVASVNDPAKLKDQPFFANAKVGDKVLLYQSARKAYLYDPSADKIINVDSITLDVGAPPAAPNGRATGR